MNLRSPILGRRCRLPGRRRSKTGPGQDGLESIEDYVERYARGASLNDPDLVFIHMLLYNHRLRAPTQEDARRWEEHFDVVRPNHFVLYEELTGG